MASGDNPPSTSGAAQAGARTSGTKRGPPALDDSTSDPVAEGSNKKVDFTSKTRPMAHAFGANIDRINSDAETYHLDAILDAAGDSKTAQYGDLIAQCNKIAATIDKELKNLEASHRSHGVFLRTWLGMGVAKVLQMISIRPLKSLLAPSPKRPPTSQPLQQAPSK